MTLVTEFHQAAFEPEVVRAMTTAYDRALQELKDQNQPELVKEVLAKRIVEAAKGGERDCERLAEIALGRPVAGPR